MDLTILLPCLNEEKTLDETIKEIKIELKKFNIKSEILVVDNGSCDNSIKIARENKVRIVRENLRLWKCFINWNKEFSRKIYNFWRL